ncbi:UNVERIFIED_CONTAM: hypothetical protein FKN15_029954 [Acipenser sinensis]
MYDQVHLNREGMKLFAKSLKDIALGRELTSTPFTERPHHMYDQVHLNREGMKLFAKSLKDIALGRELTSTPYTETRSSPSRPRAPRIPQPPRPRPHHRAASQQEQRQGPPRPPHSLQPPQHSYAAAVSHRPGNPASMELNEIRHLLNLIYTKLIR